MTDIEAGLEIEQATFGAGCFWGAEAAFRALPGVVDSRVGFVQLTAAETESIEVVQVDFNTTVLSYDQLIEHFWTLHDPTSIDRQGADVGVKYRSAVFYHSMQQAAVAREAKQQVQASGHFDKPVVTVILPLGDFQLAHEDQQQYLEKHGSSSCSI
ncbi:peptide-methionine (S)-S-oxide reductase MsrA [Pseudomonas sp. 51_B]|uniref:peptide-methionine (S)-S-oxide reductase MsrA n=1 Tax=Pseudomonas sp. 51_B TaxID=2813573 RepID=UPI001A9E51C5|nr:peptide-methionine (S)-S-oxide reductase MsrA [Pseudomonas sp. 51_B]